MRNWSDFTYSMRSGSDRLRQRVSRTRASSNDSKTFMPILPSTVNGSAERACDSRHN